MWPCGSMKLPPVCPYTFHLKCGIAKPWLTQAAILLVKLDRPLTDLHETEGTGGFPGTRFMARPVIGGHFAFLSLERACGGNALAGLEFLDVEETTEEFEYGEL